MFRRKPTPTIHPEWLIVGLGNPGAEYRGTRHNVGFEVIDLLAQRHGIKLDQSKHRARLGTGLIQGVAVVIAKPLTYMNLSGQSVAPLARQYGIKPDHVLVVADDLDLVVGRVRLKPKGSAGGHNGHKSLIASLGTTEYPRLKIGIGSSNGNTVDHVLGNFERDELDLIKEAVQSSADGVELVLSEGLEVAMNRVNR